MLHAAMFRALALVVLLGLAPPVQAAPAPIVFDFEDGLQGWELHGATQRVQTKVLGGDWAIFADGRSIAAMHPPFIEIEMDLTEIASISLEQFFVEGNEDNLFFINGVFSRLDVIEPGNPSLRAVDVSSMTGVTDVHFVWGLPTSEIVNELPPPIVAFIDNITFHPVPEPGTLTLLAGSLVALVIARRRIV